MSQPASEVSRVTPQGVKQRLDEGEPMFILDVRRERNASQIPGSFWFDPDDLLKADRILLSARKDQLIVTYCDTPHEALSAEVAERLVNQGYWNAHPLLGGYREWCKQGFPQEPRPIETLVGTE